MNASSSHHILTRAEAYAPIEGEKNIPIHRSNGEKFTFTRRWFKYRNQVSFSTFLPPKFDGTQPVNLIQIGIYEGMDLIWQFQNTLLHKDSRVVAIDPWLLDNMGGRSQDVMNKIFARARHNLAPYARKLSIIRDYSQEVLQDSIEHGSLWDVNVGEWDMVVIDGDHYAPGVLKDAELAFQMVKKGGWLLFDDVRCRSMRRKPSTVIHGLGQFLEKHGDGVKRAWSHHHCECYEKIS